MFGSIAHEVDTRLARLDVPFNSHGFDPFGVSRKHLRPFLMLLGLCHRYYFRTRVTGLEHIPTRGRAMIVANHSGGYAIDAGLIIASTFLDLDHPRLAHGMADRFLSRLPFASFWTARTGQLPGLPQHAEQLLRNDRLLTVFPEGHRGTAKLYFERYSLVEFGTGFLRLALATETPIIPAGFAGGGEAVPSVLNLSRLGRLIGVPYVPVTPYIAPFPLPARAALHFGQPIRFKGSEKQDDAMIASRVEYVKSRIQSLMNAAIEARQGSNTVARRNKTLTHKEETPTQKEGSIS